jgi:hypothetical protein
MDGPRSKVELFAAIRRESRTEKLSIHELSRRHGVHRRLVREALDLAVARCAEAGAAAREPFRIR